jgi:hypothetical protein
MGTLVVNPSNAVNTAPPDSTTGGGWPLTALTDASDASYGEETDSTSLMQTDLYTNQNIISLIPAGARVQGVKGVVRNSSTFANGKGNPYVQVVGSMTAPPGGPDPSSLVNIAYIQETRQQPTMTAIEDTKTPLVETMVSLITGGAYWLHDIFVAQQDIYWKIGESARSGGIAGFSAKFYKTWLEVVYNERPVVVVTAPSGTVINSRPTVTWTYTDPEGDPQTHYQVKIFDAATYGAVGFSADTSTPAWDSGKVVGSSLSALSGTLTNGTTYKAYVKAWQADVAGAEHYSLWDDGSAFTITINPPATPVLTATLDQTMAAVLLSISGRDNELTYNQSSLETDTTGWTAGASTTMTRTTAAGTFLHGVAGLSLQRITSIGLITAQTLAGVLGVPVVVGQQYTAVASFKAAATLRSCRVDIVWYNAAGGVISTSNGVASNDAVGSWTQLTCTATAPALAAFAAVLVNAGVGGTAAISEIHYVDQISIAPGASTTWTRGGLVNTSQRFIVERQTGAGAWEAVRELYLDATDPPVGQIVTTYDSQIPHGLAFHYRARVLSLADGVSWVEGANTANTSDLNMPLASGWWLKDPYDQAKNMKIRVSEVPKFELPKPMTTGHALGSTENVVSHDGRKAAIISLQVDTLDAATDAKLKTLIESENHVVLFLVDVLGNSWYVEMGDVEFSLMLATPIAGEGTPIRNARRYTLRLLEVSGV